jgi:hypothetical protein
VVIGAGLTGMAAAFHLGEHCLLLEHHGKLEDIDDHPDTVSMGTPRSGALGPEDPGAADLKPVFISCSSAEADTSTLIHVARWQPPEIPAAPEHDEHSFIPSVRILAPLLRGELRLGAQVTRVTPSRHLLELNDGSSIVYDTLLSTIPLSVIAGLTLHELPAHVRNNAALRSWLTENDIEVADSATRATYGDVDGFAAGKRIADRMNAALVRRFGSQSRTRPRVFEPRLVQASAAPSMP